VDGDNVNVVIENNRTENNQGKGIHYEISCAGVVRNNVIVGNGVSGLELVASQNVEVYGNLFQNNGNAMRVWHQNRGAGGNCTWALSNVRVHDNSVHMNRGTTGLWKWNVTDGDSIFSPSDGRVKFYNNTYYLSGTARYFQWMNNTRSVSEWKGYGQDLTGNFIQQ
jgi:parallel beta-helix repeat protein